MFSLVIFSSAIFGLALFGLALFGSVISCGHIRFSDIRAVIFVR